jgi:hypothetical protein
LTTGLIAATVIIGIDLSQQLESMYLSEVCAKVTVTVKEVRLSGAEPQALHYLDHAVFHILGEGTGRTAFVQKATG